MTETHQPRLFELKEFRKDSGSLCFIQEPDIPFRVKRLYWLYDLVPDEKRGGHCHLNTDRLLICLQGSVLVKLTARDRSETSYLMDHPSKALYYPRGYWIELYPREKALVVVAASQLYEEDRTLTDFKEFTALT